MTKGDSHRASKVARGGQKSHALILAFLMSVGVFWYLQQVDLDLSVWSTAMKPSRETIVAVVVEETRPVGTPTGSQSVVTHDGNANSPAAQKGETTVSPTTKNSTMTVFATPEVSQDKKSTPPPVPKKPLQANPFAKHVTIVVQLSGEMANNLHHIAHGYGLKYMLEEDHGVNTTLVLRHYEGPNNRAKNPKWKSARDNLQTCFPELAQLSFGAGNKKKDLDHKQKIQREWIGDETTDRIFGLVNSADPNEIQQGLKLLANDILKRPGRPIVEEGTSPIGIPFLLSQTLDAFPSIDRAYTALRHFLRMNETACCADLRPGPLDSVFHFRNYASELPAERAYTMGFAELSPTKVATEVFPPTHRTKHIYIATRIYNQMARNYEEALLVSAPNRTVSIVRDQTGVQDFCFLSRTHHELVGNARSTYVLWAALLSQTVGKARLYHVNTAGLRERHPNFWERFTYNFTHPDLKDRIQFELYQSEEFD